MAINEYLSIIYTCQNLITLLELKASLQPDLANEIGLAIGQNRGIIKQYEEKISALLG
jgi:uncharacterized coiled-coil protein SlyX